MLREGKVDDGGSSVVEVLRDEGTVCGRGEEGDSDTAAEEEASEVEHGDGVTFGHEGKQYPYEDDKTRKKKSP